ncbi:hypothetical protein JS562_37700 [Agrobacterium sp. S2]|nr:hypothetical protein [Agrobacterium sp. S2]
MASELKPCPFCSKTMMLRSALWPSEGDADAIIHADPTDCPMLGFSDGSADGSIIEKWNCSLSNEDDFPSDGSCVRCGSVPRNANGLCNTCLDEDAERLESTRTTPVAPVSPDATGKCGELETEFRTLSGEFVTRSQAEELLAAKDRIIKQFQSEIILGFYEDAYPIYAQGYDGAGGCELADVATAKEVNGLVDKIKTLEAHNAAKDAEREAIMQAITDPENQPSKFGTVTIAFFNEKIAAKNARAKTLEQVNAKLCDDVIDYELKIAERDVSLNELKQKLADKFSFTSDDDALAVLERYGHNETGNGIIKADMRALDDMCRAAVAYLCAEWDFVFQDTVELNREALEAKIAAAEKALEFYRDGFKYHPKRTSTGINVSEWKPTQSLLDDCGETARAVLGGKPS